MLQTAGRKGTFTSGKAAPHKRYLEAFRWMLQTRIFEEKLTSLYRGGLFAREYGGLLANRSFGGAQVSRLHREPLHFESVQLGTRSYK